jgi:hypothetical protein
MSARDILETIMKEEWPIDSEVYFLYWGEGEDFGRMGEPVEQIRKGTVSTHYFDKDVPWISISYPLFSSINRRTDRIYKSHEAARDALASYHKRRLMEVKAL